MSGKGHGVDKPGLDIVRQALENTRASLVASVAKAEPSITAGSDAHPAWRISAVNRDLLTEHKAAVHGHAGDIGDHAGNVTVARGTYSDVEEAVLGKVAAILNQRIP
jgi:hypothetical protein